jgi:hypothetical protein
MHLFYLAQRNTAQQTRQSEGTTRILPTTLCEISNNVCVVELIIVEIYQLIWTWSLLCIATPWQPVIISNLQAGLNPPPRFPSARHVIGVEYTVVPEALLASCEYCIRRSAKVAHMRGPNWLRYLWLQTEFPKEILRRLRLPLSPYDASLRVIRSNSMVCKSVRVGAVSVNETKS